MEEISPEERQHVLYNYLHVFLKSRRDAAVRARREAQDDENRLAIEVEKLGKLLEEAKAKKDAATAAWATASNAVSAAALERERAMKVLESHQANLLRKREARDEDKKLDEFVKRVKHDNPTAPSLRFPAQIPPSPANGS